MLRTIAFVLIAAVSTSAQADETMASAIEGKKISRLDPTSSWNIDYGDSRCRLGRVFGPEDSPHLLLFEQSAPASGFAITVAGPELSRFHGQSSVWIGIKDSEPMAKIERLGSGDMGKYGPALILMPFSFGTPGAERADDGRLKTRVAGIDLDEAEGASRVVIKRGGRVVSFEAGSLKEPLEALNSCSISFLEQWGLDPEKHRSYRPAKFANLELVSRAVASVYPRDALRKGESGVFRARLIIERDGSVSSCHLDEATITENLSSPACKMILERAEFEPARDASGSPMRSFYATRIVYSIN